MRLHSRVIVLCFVAGITALASAAAHAADPPWVPLDRDRTDCLPCHYEPFFGPDEAWNNSPKYGPHGYYFSTTNRCVYCHTMHEAEELVIFQETSPTAVRDTISELCFACHDSTGRMGVYSQVAALGYAVAGEHSVDVTVAVPGSTLGNLHLTCVSCHTPHNNTQMAEEWVSFNPRTVNTGYQGYTDDQTTRMLRDDVGGNPKGTYTQYGSRWCAGCHDRRHNDIPTIRNHPVDTTTAYQAYVSDPLSAPELGIFIFDPVAANAYEADGRISPRPAAPRCQQCHESTMDVEGDYDWDFGGRDSLRTIDPDGPGPSSPATVADSYPHQTTGANLLVETGDDLCLNCHSTDTLP